MVTITTKSGFSCTIDNDDWHTIELLMEADTNPMVVFKAAPYMLGAEKYKELQEHCKREDGVVSASKMIEEINEIMESDMTKNS